MDINGFKDWLIVNKSNESTVANYLQEMTYFLKCFKDVNQETINKFIANRVSLKQSKSTLNRTLSALKAWMNYTKVYFDLPKYKRPDEKIRPYITEDEMQKMVTYMEEIFEFNQLRNKIVLQLLFYSGLRIKEFVTLTRDKINLDKGEILLTNTKTGQERLAGIPMFLIPRIREYFAKYEEEFNAFNVTAQAIRKMLTTINEQLNLKQRLHPHLLRRSFAKFFLKKHPNVFVLKDLMGHKQLSTTYDYAKDNPADTMLNYHKFIK